MKKSVLVGIFALLGLCQSSYSQQKAITKAIIKTPSIQCEMCKEKIEKFLIREYGVTTVKVDYRKKTTTVSWITDRTNIENIKAAIANAGYDADDITAEESAYKRLPKCCKKPEIKPVPLKA